MKKTTQERLEMIIIRLNRIYPEERIKEIFKEAAKLFKESGYPVHRFSLCKSEQVENDWAVWLHCSETKEGMEPGGTEQLSRMLRSVGLIHHSIWKTCESVEILPPAEPAERRSRMKR
ncbi:MAG: hypothetical protein MI862_18310 [Desulfobacterales bacterium]|nr:hypothetical protein [Desulfobacterales bacterium]